MDAPGSSGSAARCSPEGSSRSTPALRPVTRADVPPPVTQVIDAAHGLAAADDGRGRGAPRPRSSATGDDRLARRGRGDPRRRRQAPAPDARPALRRARGRRRRDPRRDRDRAGPHGDARPRRRPRRGAAAPRPADRRRPVRPRDGDGRRRPALLARLRRAEWRRAASARSALLANASVGLARGELAQRRDAFDLTIDAERYLQRCRLKTARLFECACVIGGDHGAAGGRGADRLRPRDRPRLPAPRRRPRRQRARPSAPARRAAPTCSTAP